MGCCSALHLCLARSLNETAAQGQPARSDSPFGVCAACVGSVQTGLRLAGFLEQCFAALLKALYGYDGPSWLNTAAKVCALQLLEHLQAFSCLAVQGESTTDRKALVSLLAPQGRLMQAIHSADADALLQFKFPLERLPSHTQILLASEAGRCSPN